MYKSEWERAGSNLDYTHLNHCNSKSSIKPREYVLLLNLFCLNITVVSFISQIIRKSSHKS